MGYHAELLERYSAVRGRLWEAPLRRQRQADMLRERRMVMQETRIRLLKFRLAFAIRAAQPFKRTIRDILTDVARRHDVTVKDLMSRHRTDDLARARHEAFYLARVYTNKSMPEIGRRMGGFDHTSVLHGIKKHCKRHGLEYPKKGEAS